jgi:hypothetical protein
MRRLVNTVMLAISRLGNVVGTAAFLYVSFGIFGIYFFGGALQRRCRLIPDPILVNVGIIENKIFFLCVVR